MTGHGIREVRGPVPRVDKGPAGPPPLPGAGVAVQSPADPDRAVAADRLDPQRVPIRQRPARFPGLKAVVISPADDQITGRRPRAVSQPHLLAVIDEADVDQVVTDPPGRFPAPFPVMNHQQRVTPGQVMRDIPADRVVHRPLRVRTEDPAVLVVLIQRRHVPGAQPQRRVPLPRRGEPDRLGELHVAQPPGEQHHPAAGLDRGELFLVPGDDHLRAALGRVADDLG